MIKSIYDLPQKHWNRLKTQITLEVKGKIMNVKNNLENIVINND